MNDAIRVIGIGSLLIIAALVLGACSTLPSAPVYAPGGMRDGGMTGGGGMMGGGRMMDGNGMMDGGGMMGGDDYDPYAPTAPPSPGDATPAVVDEEIPITISDYRFKPDQITVRPGETVRFVVTNKDGALHNFVGRDAGVPYLDLPARSTQTLTWTVPARAGTYTVVCTLHPGMNLSIVATE